MGTQRRCSQHEERFSVLYVAGPDGLRGNGTRAYRLRTPRSGDHPVKQGCLTVFVEAGLCFGVSARGISRHYEAPRFGTGLLLARTSGGHR